MPVIEAAPLTADQGAGPGYSGAELGFQLRPAPSGGSGPPPPSPGVRGFLLVAGTTDGSLGAVCARTDEDARLVAAVACRALGWTGTASAVAQPPPFSAEPVLWSSLKCQGNETDLASCEHTQVVEDFAGCDPKARLVIECAADKQGQEGDLRFREAPADARGYGPLPDYFTYELLSGGFWAPLTGVTPAAAVVLCREAGFEGGIAGVDQWNPGWKAPGRAPAATLHGCAGDEASVADCAKPYSPEQYGQYGMDGQYSLPEPPEPTYYGRDSFFWLSCRGESNATTEPEASDGVAVRLDGARYGTGRCVMGSPQVMVGGFWGKLMAPMADDPRSAQNVGKVLCRQLGVAVAGNVSIAYLAVDGGPILPTWMDSVACKGDEASVLDCSYRSAVLPLDGAATSADQILADSTLMMVTCNPGGEACLRACLRLGVCLTARDLATGGYSSEGHACQWQASSGRLACTHTEHDGRRHSLDAGRYWPHIQNSMQARREQRAGAVVLTTAAKENARPVMAIKASSSQRDLYTDHDYQLVQQMKRTHRDTTSSAQRAVQLATETTAMAQGTLDALYLQGQQLEQATHGVEQIGEDVKHAGRIVAFMGRFCCFRNSWNDPDALAEARGRGVAVQQQRMAGVLAAQQSAELYAAKRQAVDAALAKHGPLPSPAAANAAAAAAAGPAPRGTLIPAVPGQRQGGSSGEAATAAAAAGAGARGLGHGLHPYDQQELAAETAKQEECLDQIEAAMGALKAMGLAMGQELEEQVPKVEALQQRTEDAGLALRGVASGAAKLAGRAPGGRRRAGSGGAGESWQGDQAASAAAVARAVQAGAPIARRYNGVR